MNTITMKISGLLCFSGCLLAGEATIWEELSNQTDQSIQQTYDRISECICFNTKKIKVVVELKNMPEFQNTQFTTTKIIVNIKCGKSVFLLPVNISSRNIVHKLLYCDSLTAA